MVKALREMADEKILGACIPFESADEQDHHVNQTLFNDHPKGLGIPKDPRSVLRMGIERMEELWSIWIQFEEAN